MGTIKLRGEHIKDFWFYLDSRREGKTQEAIFEQRTIGEGLAGVKNERLALEIYRQIYGGEQDSVVLVGGYDDICNGNESNKRVNRGEELGKCPKFGSKYCLCDEVVYMDNAFPKLIGFSVNTEVSGTELVEKVAKLKLLDFFEC